MSPKNFLRNNVTLMQITGTFRIRTDSTLKKTLFQLWRIALNLAAFYFFVGNFVDLVQTGNSDFKKTVMHFIYFGLSACFFIKFHYCSMFEDNLRDIIEEMGNTFKHSTNTGLEEVHLQGYIDITNKLTCLWAIVTAIAAQSIIAFPFIFGGKSERTLPLPLWFPFDWKVSPYYELTLFYEEIVLVFMAETVIAVDTVFASAVILTTVQIKMLGLEIKHLLKKSIDREIMNSQKRGDEELTIQEPQLDELLKTDDFLAHLLKELNKLVEFHQLLASFCERVEDFFSPLFLPYYIVMLSMVIFLGYILTTTNDVELIITFIMCIVAGELTLFVPCYFGHLITTQSEQLVQDLYDSPWYVCDKKFKTNFQIVHQRACKPILLTVGKFGSLSLNMYLGIVRATFSYLTVLRKITQ